MAIWKIKEESILKIVGKDGPIWKEMHKPQVMYVKHKDYGVKKLYKRLGKKSKVVR